MASITPQSASWPSSIVRWRSRAAASHRPGRPGLQDWAEHPGPTSPTLVQPVRPRVVRISWSYAASTSFEPLLAARGQGVDPRAADQAAAGAEGHGPHHVGAGADAAVHQHRQAVAHRIGDGRKRLDRGQRPVELPPAVVGDDQAVGADLDALAGVVGVENLLDDDGALPPLADPGQVGPGELESMLLRIQPAKSDAPLALGRASTRLP